MQVQLSLLYKSSRVGRAMEKGGDLDVANLQSSLACKFSSI